MPGSQITNSLSSGVTLGSILYPSPLTIGSTGTINTAGATGVYANTAGVSLLNDGVITAANDGVQFAAGGTITNNGVITGTSLAGLSLGGTNTIVDAGRIQAGTAAAGSSAGTGIILGTGATLSLSGRGQVDGGAAIEGATAGVGIEISSAASLFTAGEIFGGTAVSYASGPGGMGGVGVEVMPGGYLYNHNGNILNEGIIRGGSGGGSSDFFAGAGGAGLYLATTTTFSGGVPTLLNQGTVVNNGLITGGTGGYGSGSAVGGNGGEGVFVATAGTFTNNGAIKGGIAGGNPAHFDGVAGQGVYLANYASLTNTGLVSGAAGLDDHAGGLGVYAHGNNVIINEVSISGGIGGYYAGGSGNGGTGVYLNQSVLANYGQITGGNAGGNNVATSNAGYGGTGVYINGGAVINWKTIAGGASNGTIGYAVQFAPGAAGLLEVLPTAVFIGNVAAVAGAGDVLELALTTGTLDGIGTQFTGFDEISFAPEAAWNILGDTAGLETSLGIGGFTLGDTITLTGISGVSETETYSNGELTLASGGSVLATLSFTGEASSITSADFAISTDGTNTTIAAALCYLRGTHILTPLGERLIEDLCIGDLVVTRFSGVQPVKWIGRQTYNARFLHHNPGKMPVCIRAGALADAMPARDLYVSPGHSMLLGETLVLARNLLNGVTITQDLNRDGVVDYYQLELAAHDCVIAEGAWSETYADGPGLRGQFHNAAEYHALYPDVPSATALHLCVERPEEGPALSRALQPVVARAAAGLTAGPLEGFIDHISATSITGWARDQAHPWLPVMLDFMWRGRLLGSLLACDSRDDLPAAGKGNCAFAFTPPAPLPPQSWTEITVQRAGGGERLDRTAAFWEERNARKQAGLF